MSKVKPRVDTTQAPTPAKEEEKKEEPATDANADKNDGPGEMDVD